MFACKCMVFLLRYICVMIGIKQIFFFFKVKVIKFKIIPEHSYEDNLMSQRE